MSKKLLSPSRIFAKFICLTFENAGWKKLNQYWENVYFDIGRIYFANVNTIDKKTWQLKHLNVNFVMIK